MCVRPRALPRCRAHARHVVDRAEAVRRDAARHQPRPVVHERVERVEVERARVAACKEIKVPRSISLLLIVTLSTCPSG